MRATHNRRWILGIVILCTLTAQRAAAGDPAFVLDIDTRTTPATFTLPIDTAYGYDCTVNWGDGNTLVYTTGTAITHGYASSGSYTIRITENSPSGFPAVSFLRSSEQAVKVTHIANWGDVTWRTMRGAFSGCSNLTITAVDHATARTNLVTSFAWAFYNCSSLTTFPLLNTRAGTDFTSAWSWCYRLESFPLLDFSHAITIKEAWTACTALETFPLIVTDNVQDMSIAWSGCSALRDFPAINTGSCTDFTSTWGGCQSLRAFPLLDTSKGTEFMGTWSACTGLTEFPVLNVARGQNFQQAWSWCRGLSEFPVLNTRAGTNFMSAWYSCTGLSHFPVLNTSHGTNFNSAWAECSGLVDFPLIDTHAGVDFTGTWSNCVLLSSFPLLDTSAGAVFDNTWSGCLQLVNFPHLNLRNITSGLGIFYGSGISIASYTYFVMDWGAHATHDGVRSHGGLFSPAAWDAYTYLVNTKGWTLYWAEPEVYYWRGGTGNWSNVANWNAKPGMPIIVPPAGAIVQFESSSVGICTIDVPVSLDSVWNDRYTGSINLGTNTLTVSRALYLASTQVTGTTGSIVLSGTTRLAADNGSSVPHLRIASGTTTMYAFNPFHLVVTGNMTIDPGATCVLAGSLHLGGDWTNRGTVVPNFCALTLDGAGGTTQHIRGSSTFYGLGVTPGPSRTIAFEAGTTQTITGYMYLNGDVNQHLLIRSSVNGSAAMLTGTFSGSGDYLDIQDSSVVGHAAINPTNSINRGNTSGWFTSAGSPAITAISPNTGSTLGATTVTITGVNLGGYAQVYFDGIPATSVTAISSTQVSVVTPAHPAGTVDIGWASAGGITQASGGFTYVATSGGTQTSSGGGSSGGGGGGCGVGGLAAGLLCGLAMLRIRRQSNDHHGGIAHAR